MLDSEMSKGVRLEITKNTKGYTYSAKVTSDTTEALQIEMGKVLEYAEAKVTQLNVGQQL